MAAPTPTPQSPPLRPQHAAAQKTWPDAHLQVAPGFRLLQAINDAAEEGVEIPLADESRHFCLSYHLIGVRKSNCGGCHSDRTMSQGNMGWMMAWKEHF